MNMDLFNSTKLAAYFLWEATGHDNALSLWYCAEDIASFLERYEIQSEGEIVSILRQGVTDPGYVHFIRHIAFRIFVYTNRDDAEANWFAAESLAANIEWRRASVDIARIYGESAKGSGALSGVKSDAVREYYQ